MLPRIGSAALLLSLAGCAKSPRTIEAAFPVSTQASPWVLRGAVWSGPPTAAAAAVGDDWAKIEPHAPSRVWLAVYQHERMPGRTITARTFAFATPERARRAFDALRPNAAAEFKIGDAGCWTDLGVLFTWDNALFELFGNEKGWEPAWQTVFIAGLIENKLPPRRNGSNQ